MLEIKNIKVISKEGDLIIQDASLVLEVGKIISLSGVNGSGKTSLLNAIFKNYNYKIESGSIILDEKDITNLETHELVRNGLYLGLQFVPEIAGISVIKFLYKAYQNIYPDSKKSILDFKKEVEEKLDIFNIDKKFLGENLNTNYSGGEKKIATLVHVLALMPKYIFLDEVDSGVDAESLQKIYKIINYLRDNGSSVLLVSHNKNIGEYISFDSNYILENKKITN